MDMLRSRIASLKECPNDIRQVVNVLQLAKAGFYYDKHQQTVRCSKCWYVITDYRTQIHHTPEMCYRNQQNYVQHINNQQNYAKHSSNQQNQHNKMNQQNYAHGASSNSADQELQADCGQDECDGLIVKCNSNIKDNCKSTAQCIGVPSDNAECVPIVSSHVKLGTCDITPDKTKQENMRTYNNRFASFTKGALEGNTCIAILARNGLYQDSTDSLLRCAFCPFSAPLNMMQQVLLRKHAAESASCKIVRAQQKWHRARNRSSSESSVYSSSSMSEEDDSLILKVRVEDYWNVPWIMYVYKFGFTQDAVYSVTLQQLNSTGEFFSGPSAMIKALIAHQDAEDELFLGLRNESSAADNNTHQLHADVTMDTADGSTAAAVQPTHKSAASHRRKLVPGKRKKQVVSERKKKEETEKMTSLMQQLQDEIEDLEDDVICKLCIDEEACIVFLPCGHLCCCAACAPTQTNCPICRTTITQVVHVET